MNGGGLLLGELPPGPEEAPAPGAVPVRATPEDTTDLVGDEIGNGGAAVGGGEATEVAATVVGAGGEVASALVSTAGVVEAGAAAAVAAQLQTSAAMDWAARAVAGLQADKTQPMAALAIMADWDELHPQATSPTSHTPAAAEDIQVCCISD